MLESGHKLLTTEREQLILESLRRSETLSAITLSGILGVSVATVRRDLESLQSRGFLFRVHGGATIRQDSAIEPIFSDKEGKYGDEKRRIADGALALIEDYDSIYLDGGSTVLCLARLLECRRSLTIVTNSLMAASLLMESGHRLILTGGEFRALSRTLVGPLTAHILREITVDKAFMGTIGLTLEDGMSTTDANEAYTKNLIISRARQVILLADSSKQGVSSFVTCGGLDAIDILVTDALSTPFKEYIAQQKIKVVLV